MRAFTFLIFVSMVIQHQLSYGQCPNTAVYLTTQDQVDQFSINYPGCSDFTNDLIISGNEINNLNGLTGLEQINLLEIKNTGSLISLGGLNNVNIVNAIYLDNNASLTSLNGLQNLTTIEILSITDNPVLNDLSSLSKLSNIENLYIEMNQSLVSLIGLQGLNSITGTLSISSNNALASLSGLENLYYVGDGIQSFDPGFWIVNNQNLLDLSSLQNLTYIDGTLNIRSNSLLTNLSGLESLSFLRILSIQSNNSLHSLDGLQGLTNVETFISIYNNSTLESLQGLDNLNSIPTENTVISTNPNLSFCSVSGICKILNIDPSLISISNTQSGCANAVEVNLICQDPCSVISDYLSVHNDPILPGTYDAKISLSSTGHIYSGLIGINSIKFRAGDSVELQGSFEVEQGSEFEVEIVDFGCF